MCVTGTTNKLCTVSQRDYRDMGAYMNVGGKDKGM